MATGGVWFKYGCFGCLGFVAVLLVAVLVLSGWAFVTAQPEQVEDRILTPGIPAELSGKDYTGGRVVLEFREAEVYIEPAEPGEPLRVEARYDVNTFAIEEEFDPGAGRDGAFRYSVTFGRGDRSGAFSGLVSLARGGTARIRVFLPTDVPIDLDLEVKEGAAVVRLGGLWLRTAEIDCDSGAFDLDVEEPLREPMESLTIRTAKGGALMNHLGNASPRRLDVSYRIGGIDMDLGGHWLADSDISISGGMGGGTVHLPSGVIMEGLDLDGVKIPVATELKLPTLRFSVSTGLGKLEFSDWAANPGNPD